MDNQERAKVEQWYYNNKYVNKDDSIGRDAPFMLRATGKFQYEKGFSEPLEEDLEKWKVEMELDIALKDQKRTCIDLLDESEKSVSQDPPYPADIAKWKTFRGKLRTILKGNKIVVIPEKPF